MGRAQRRGPHEADVTTVAELDAVLHQVAAQATAENIPFAVQVHHADARGSIMIGIGHPDRSFIDWLASDGYHEYGYEPALPAATEPVAFDVYGDWHEHPPHKLRVRPATASHAVREYVVTGQRPTCVEWAAE
jgi:hypothetical protein